MNSTGVYPLIAAGDRVPALAGCGDRLGVMISHVGSVETTAAEIDSETVQNRFTNAFDSDRW